MSRHIRFGKCLTDFPIFRVRIGIQDLFKMIFLKFSLCYTFKQFPDSTSALVVTDERSDRAVQGSIQL